jgi:alpha-tubulin suppressor-like RCC1 family protein
VRPIRRSLAAATVTIGIGTALFWSVPGAVAVTPDSGPTAGGTRVTDPLPDEAVTAISGGLQYTVVTTSAGRSYAWGRNDVGQLGDGGTADSVTPVEVVVPDGVVLDALSGRQTFTLALGSDGSGYAWGQNVGGSLGDGSTANSPVPVRVQTPPGVTLTAISAGVAHGVGLGSDGITYAWGANNAGQLGDGTGNDSAVPVPVQAPSGVTFTAVSAGGNFTVALGSDGAAYAWGSNSYGQLGDGTTTTATAPVAVQAPAGVTFTSVQAGGSFVVATGSDGQTYAWGRNSARTLGDGTTTNSSVPVLVLVPDGITLGAISVGNEFTVATGSDGGTYSWGSNVYGQLGTGGLAGSGVPVPVQAPAGVALTGTSANYYHAVAFGSDGQLYAWGRNTSGELGAGTQTTARVPVRVIAGDRALTSVLFGQVAGTDLDLGADGWAATTPAQGCGTVDVVAEYTQFGQSRSLSTPQGFTYGSAPVVTADPDGAELPVGGGVVTLTAAAAGDDVPTVQWQQRAAGADWVDVPGATATDLTAQVGADTEFRAIFANCLGSAVTATAAVTVAAAPAPGLGPVPDPDPTPVPDPTPAPGDPGAEGGVPRLAQSGSDLGSALLVGGSAIAVGGLLLASRRLLRVRRV